jgi:hypothetical protein
MQQDGYKKSTWFLTWHPMDHVSQSFGLFSKTIFLEIGLTQNQETMAFRKLTTVSLFSFIIRENPRPHEYKFMKIGAFGCRHDHIWLHTTLEGP